MQKEMIKAAKTGDVARVEELLLADAALIGATDTDGSTPLHYAVWKGHQEVVVKLLEAGADVKAHNRNEHWGTTPLHAAAHANRSAIEQLLIEHGAEIEAKDSKGKTPLDHTTYHNSRAAAKLLQKHGATA
jgi:hypothetical protein